MRAVVQESSVKGTVAAPPSKSYTHRAIVCGLLSSGLTRILKPLICDDTQVSLHLSKLMGAQITLDSKLVIAGPEELIAPSSPMNCRESGTSLRFFTALAGLTRGRCVLTGDSALRKRPMIELVSSLNQLGIETKYLDANEKLPLEVTGNGIGGGTIRIRGDVSSQYISGLLFACSKGERKTFIELTTPLESQSYVEMTLEVMRNFGVVVESLNGGRTFALSGQQEYHSTDYEIEGDYSSAAFLIVAGAIAGDVKVTNLDSGSIQGDSEIVKILQRMGNSLREMEYGFQIQQTEMNGLEIDASNIPDLVPILAVLATQAQGQTVIVNAARVRYKESNRLNTICTELLKLGADIKETHNGIVINGGTPLTGANLRAHGDHRIGMACVIAGLVARGTTTVEGIECVNKSYPHFLEHMRSLDADIKIETDQEEGDVK